MIITVEGRSMGRNDLCFCGSGKKYKRCHSTIRENSKLANMYRAYSSFDEYAKKEKLANNCPVGCHSCCDGVHFFVCENEFLLILDFLLMNKKSDIESIIERAIDYCRIFKKVFPDAYMLLEEKLPTQKVNGDSISSVYDKYFNDVLDRGLEHMLPECIFMDGNELCSIYSVRPGICRFYGTTNHCDKLGNGKLVINETKKLIEQTDFLRSKKSSAVLQKRPYPLFYWFSHFMLGNYYDVSIKKVETIKNLTEEGYYYISKSRVG